MRRVALVTSLLMLLPAFSGAATPLPVGASGTPSPTGSAAGGEATTNGPPRQLVEEATHYLADDKVDLALGEVNMAIELDPRNVAAYELRSSIYVREKVWDRAERDIAAADKIAPDVAYKYKLGEIKFLQKDYTGARPRFSAIDGDSRLGDLATYKVFLCDLLAGHASIAARDLAALNVGDKRAPYYFSHAAQALVDGKRAEANQWFSQAQGLYGSQVVALYVSSLQEIQLLQLETASFVTKDGQSFTRARISLEPDGLRTASATGWVTLPLDQLPDDLSPFSSDIRQEIIRRRSDAATRAEPSSLLSFTTRSGHAYQQVRWSLHEGSLEVLTGDGWTAIPVSELPENTSSFPPEVQTALLEKHGQLPAGPGVTAASVSFATKSGKAYSDVRASVSDRGLAVLTPDGWVTMPFADLPDDLSPFPRSWRSEILEARDTAQSSGPQHISFTTRKGKSYSDVRTLLLTDGLSVVTSEGIVSIPFSQLPEDLSPFPPSWRETIAERRSKPPHAPIAARAANRVGTGLPLP